MYRLTESSGHPGNVIVLSDGAPDEAFSNLSCSDVGDLEKLEGVLEDDGKPMASWEVYVVVNMQIKDPAAGRRTRASSRCAAWRNPPSAARFTGWSCTPAGSGSTPPASSSRAGSYHQAVIGEGIARELGPDLGKKTLEVGDVFDLGPRKWIVAGILKSAGSTFDSEVWAKFELVGELFGKKTYTTVRAADRQTPRRRQALAEDLTANYKKPAVNAQPEPEYYAKLNTTNQQFLVAISIVVAIMAVGGVFGVMNTMFAAISQRTKDIGVLRILGFTRWQVLMSFFLESLVLALHRRPARLRAGLAGRRLDGDAASSAAARAAARAWC